MRLSIILSASCEFGLFVSDGVATCMDYIVKRSFKSLTNYVKVTSVTRSRHTIAIMIVSTCKTITSLYYYCYLSMPVATEILSTIAM
jgi:hypothetical protein